jgi:hypothetical protein
MITKTAEELKVEENLKRIRLINEEKHLVQKGIEAIARHRELSHATITIATLQESYTFQVTPEMVQLLLNDLDWLYQCRNLELTEKAEALMS